MQMIIVHRHTNESSSGNVIDCLPLPVAAALHLSSKFLSVFLKAFIVSALWIIFHIGYHILLAPLFINEQNKSSATCSLYIYMRTIILSF